MKCKATRGRVRARARARARPRRICQTVPAEAWVGPAVATTGTASSRDTVTAEMRRFMSMPQAAQDAWVGASGGTVIAVGAAKRSGVLADLKLLDRAGLVACQASEAFDPYSAESRRRTACYQRLRNGSEFAREVARETADAAHRRPDRVWRARRVHGRHPRPWPLSPGSTTTNCQGAVAPEARLPMPAARHRAPQAGPWPRTSGGGSRTAWIVEERACNVWRAGARHVQPSRRGRCANGARAQSAL
jgi:hypothetical protein